MSPLSRLARGVGAVVGLQEILLLAGLTLYTYGRYLEAPTRALVELGAVLTVLGMADHMPLWVARFRAGTKGKR